MKPEKSPHIGALTKLADSHKPPASLTRRNFGKAALGASAALLLPGNSLGLEQDRSPQLSTSAVKNVVLVHGAFADGSSWSRVIPLLEAKGFQVTAVQNPLTSFPEDVETTSRFLAAQSGPVILVGHSYAGMVITEAGNAPNVAGLVYVSSYGPAEGESHDDLVKRYSPPGALSAIRKDDNGFLWILRDRFHEAFAHDVDLPQARLMAAVQKPLAKKCFAAPVGVPAWKSKPSAFLISEDDRLVNPELQYFMAKRMGAAAQSVPSSHASLVSHPDAVAKQIAEIANR